MAYAQLPPGSSLELVLRPMLGIWPSRHPGWHRVDSVTEEKYDLNPLDLSINNQPPGLSMGRQLPRPIPERGPEH